jgi:hypothetical protein
MFYPGYMNHQLPWAPDAKSYLPILQMHDTHLLWSCVKKELEKRFGSRAAAILEGAASTEGASRWQTEQSSPTIGSDAPMLPNNAGKRSKTKGRKQSPPAAAGIGGARLHRPLPHRPLLLRQLRVLCPPPGRAVAPHLGRQGCERGEIIFGI